MRSAWIISVIRRCARRQVRLAIYQNSATRQQIEQISVAVEKGYEKQDAAGIAGLFAKDGVLLTVIGKHVYRGPQKFSNSIKVRIQSGL